MKAELIKNYVFANNKKFTVFDNKYYVVTRHLVKIKGIPTGIQVYDNPNFIGSFGRMYFKNNQIQVYQEGKEVAYCTIDNNFLKEIESKLPKTGRLVF